MADDKKKSKIDLKARLGKSTMSGAPGAAVPMPTPGAPASAPGSDPGVPPAGGAPAPSPSVSSRPPPAAAVGIAPPPGLSPGIPVPPFAQPKQAAPAPKPSAAQQTIKVEVGEEIHAERKKAKQRIYMAAAGATLLGVGIGFVIGGAKERSDRGAVAVAVAQAVEKDVKESNGKIKELSEKLDAAAEKLGRKAFPAELVTELGGINIPFDLKTLEAKNVGALPGKLLRPLIQYGAACDDLNKTKDSLKNLLGFAQPQIEKYWKEEKEPVVNFSVVFGPDGSRGMMAELVKNKEPFPAGKDWPANYSFLRTERTQQGVKEVDKKAVRWTKGDLTGSDPVVIPVMPSSVAGFTSEQVVTQLGKNLRDLRETIEGRKDDPNAPPGLLSQGENLATELRKAALAR